MLYSFLTFSLSLSCVMKHFWKQLNTSGKEQAIIHTNVLKGFFIEHFYFVYFRDGEFAFDMHERKADTIVKFMKE